MQGNKIVLLLPVSVMIGLFIFGYMSLIGTANLTNEEMEHDVTLNVRNTDDREIEVQWQWPDFPEDGVRGEDFIEIILPDDGKEIIESVDMELFQGEDVIYSSEDSFFTDDGLAVPFPNALDEEMILGPSGKVTVSLSDETDTDILVRYFHTWEDHQAVPDDDEASAVQTILENAGVNQFWVIERRL